MPNIAIVNHWRFVLICLVTCYVKHMFKTYWKQMRFLEMCNNLCLCFYQKTEVLGRSGRSSSMFYLFCMFNTHMLKIQHLRYCTVRCFMITVLLWVPRSLLSLPSYDNTGTAWWKKNFSDYTGISTIFALDFSDPYYSINVYKTQILLYFLALSYTEYFNYAE